MAYAQGAGGAGTRREDEEISLYTLLIQQAAAQQAAQAAAQQAAKPKATSKANAAGAGGGGAAPEAEYHYTPATPTSPPTTSAPAAAEPEYHYTPAPAYTPPANAYTTPPATTTPTAASQDQTEIHLPALMQGQYNTTPPAVPAPGYTSPTPAPAAAPSAPSGGTGGSGGTAFTPPTPTPTSATQPYVAPAIPALTTPSAGGLPTAAQLYQQYLQQQQAHPGEYASPYDDRLEELYNQISNRPPFEYDLQGDMLYQQYVDQYQRLGQNAMMNAVGNASAMTGGYGNTYAATSGQQAYDSYLQQLNNIVPSLRAGAFNEYLQEGNDLYNLMGITQQLENTAYGQYQDQITNWEDLLNLYNSQWTGQQQQEYQQAWNQQQFEYGAQQDAQTQAYQQATAILAAGQIPTAELLAAANIDANTAQQLATFYAQQNRPTSSGGGGGGSTSSASPGRTQITQTMLDSALNSYNASGSSGLNQYLDGLYYQGYAPAAIQQVETYALGYGSNTPAQPATTPGPIGSAIGAVGSAISSIWNSIFNRD